MPKTAHFRRIKTCSRQVTRAISLAIVRVSTLPDAPLLCVPVSRPEALARVSRGCRVSPGTLKFKHPTPDLRAAELLPCALRTITCFNLKKTLGIPPSTTRRPRRCLTKVNKCSNNSSTTTWNQTTYSTSSTKMSVHKSTMITLR